MLGFQPQSCRRSQRVVQTAHSMTSQVQSVKIRISSYTAYACLLSSCILLVQGTCIMHMHSNFSNIARQHLVKRVWCAVYQSCMTAWTINWKSFIHAHRVYTYRSTIVVRSGRVCYAGPWSFAVSQLTYLLALTPCTWSWWAQIYYIMVHEYVIWDTYVCENVFSVTCIRWSRS